MANSSKIVGADDGIEADFCMHNCRVVRNRLTSCFVGLSSQPGLGGPTYFIRNVMYGLTYVPFKFHRGSRGDVCLHNTVVKVGDGMACFSRFDFALFRNNLCIGGPPGAPRWGNYSGGSGKVAQIGAGPHCDFDYDALGTHELPFQGSIGEQRFSSLEELRKGPYEQHAIQVDMSVFQGEVCNRDGRVVEWAAIAPRVCPVGAPRCFLGTDRCLYRDADVRKHQKKVSGSLLDRIDLQVESKPLSTEERFTESAENASSGEEKRKKPRENQGFLRCFASACIRIMRVPEGGLEPPLP